MTMVSNVKTCSKVIIIDSAVLTHALVKYYGFSGSFIRLYSHTLVFSYEGIFTPYHLYKNNIIGARPLEYYSCIIFRPFNGQNKTVHSSSVHIQWIQPYKQKNQS